jgi:hypothetical protein
MTITTSFGWCFIFPRLPTSLLDLLFLFSKGTVGAWHEQGPGPPEESKVTHKLRKDTSLLVTLEGDSVGRSRTHTVRITLCCTPRPWHDDKRWPVHVWYLYFYMYEYSCDPRKDIPEDRWEYMDSFFWYIVAIVLWKEKRKYLSFIWYLDDVQEKQKSIHIFEFCFVMSRIENKFVGDSGSFQCLSGLVDSWEMQSVDTYTLSQ